LFSNSVELIVHWLTRRGVEVLSEPNVDISSHAACVLGIVVSLWAAVL